MAFGGANIFAPRKENLLYTPNPVEDISVQTTQKFDPWDLMHTHYSIGGLSPYVVVQIVPREWCLMRIHVFLCFAEPPDYGQHGL